MSAPVVRSSLREVDPKTQTRRIVKARAPVDATSAGVFFATGRAYDGEWNWLSGDPRDVDSWCWVGEPFRCPYGEPGDRLWVRETWGVGSRPDPWGGYDGIEYRADQAWLEEGDDLPCHKVQTPDDVCLGDYRSGWKPSIHMPRWACRLVLEVTGVRVERLQDISEADAIAEGIEADVQPGDQTRLWRNYASGGTTISPVYSYQTLWELINGPGSWDANPWVWVVEFRRLP